MDNRRMVSQPVATEAIFQKGSATPMLVLVLTAVLLVLGTVALKVTTSDLQASTNAKQAVETLYIADAGFEHARNRLSLLDIDSVLKTVDSSRFSSGQQVTVADSNLKIFTDTFSFGSGGKYRVLVYDNDDGDGNIRSDSDGVIFVRSIGMHASGSARAIEAVLAKVTTPVITERGAVVALGNVATLGNLTVDGREHDMNGNVIVGGGGTKGVITAGDFDRGGNSKVGGVDDFGFPYDPTKTDAIVDKVADEGVALPIPAGPDEAIGLTDGTLMAMAKSGAGGSQYVTDPSKITHPIKGVTYVDLPCGGKWSSMDFGAAQGIIVVHSPCNDAVIENLNGGILKGILIADDIVRVHNNILGMILQISPAPPSGNCLGNGTGSIRYSSLAITQALTSLSLEVRVVAWREL